MQEMQVYYILSVHVLTYFNIVKVIMDTSMLWEVFHKALRYLVKFKLMLQITEMKPKDHLQDPVWPHYN